MYIAKEIPNLTNIVCDCCKAVTAVLNWCNAWNTEGAGETWRVVEGGRVWALKDSSWNTPSLLFPSCDKNKYSILQSKTFYQLQLHLEYTIFTDIFRAAWKSLNSRSGAYVICSKINHCIWAASPILRSLLMLALQPRLDSVSFVFFNVVHRVPSQRYLSLVSGSWEYGGNISAMMMLHGMVDFKMRRLSEWA